MSSITSATGEPPLKRRRMEPVPLPLEPIEPVSMTFERVAVSHRLPFLQICRHLPPADILSLSLLTKKVRAIFLKPSEATLNGVAHRMWGFSAGILAAKKLAAIIPPLNQPSVDKTRQCIAEVEAIYDIPAAKKTAASIDDTLLKAKACIAIAKADPAHDLTEARAATAKETHLTSVVKLHCAMAEVDPNHDLTPAINAATTLSLLYGLYGQQSGTLYSTAAYTLVKTLAPRDLEAAKWIAELIFRKDIKAKAYCAIAKYDPEYDIKQLKKYMSSIHFYHADFWVDFIELLATRNLRAARGSLRLINDSFSKISAYCAIAKADPAHKLTRAKEIAASNPTSDYRTQEAYVEITEIEAVHDKESAKETALLATLPSYIVESLHAIRQVDPTNDLLKRKAKAMEIEDTQLRAQALAWIAEACLSYRGFFK